MIKSTLTALILGAALIATPAAAETAQINGLEMYYEVHGDGPPLVLLHGAYMSIDTNWDALIPTFAETHKVIAVELQAHGHTSDRDTPITYEGMSEDVAALLDHLEIDKAAIFGYSMGASVGIRLAMDHPEKVERLIVASGGINYDAYPDGFYEMIETITPEMMAGSPFEEEYKRLSPNPDGFPTLVEKLKALDLDRFAWDEEAFAAIDVPTLLVFGDADVVEIDHITKLFTLLGGHSNGDMQGLPLVQLAVLPGTSHINVIFNPANIEYLKAMVPTFLAQELPAPPQMTF